MKRTRTFHLVWGRLTRLLTTMLTFVGLATFVLIGCEPMSGELTGEELEQEDVDNPVATNLNSTEKVDVSTDDTSDTEISTDRQAELTELAQEWIDTRDDSLIQQIQSEQELRFVGELLQQWQNETDADSDPPVQFIAGCGGYWGTYRIGDKAELLVYNPGVYRYYWSPNCAMPAPGNDCGTDHNDNMVSFWMGPDYTYTEAEYKTDSSNWYTYWTLVLHGGGSYRVYTSNAYGAWYGNAYVCLSNRLDASTLRFGRRY